MRIRPILLASLLVTAAAVAQGPRPGGPGGPGGPRPGPGPGGPRTPPTPATSATFTNFGNPCGADLNGTVGPNLEIGLDVTNAAASAFGSMVIGPQSATPTPLPVGTCDLLVDRQRFFGGMFFRTDANGAATLALPRTPPAGITVSFQALVFVVDPVAQTRTMTASNGTELVTQ